MDTMKHQMVRKEGPGVNHENGGAELSKVYGLERGVSAICRKIEAMKKNITRPFVAGVAGGSGSGKTTKVAKKIQDRFPGSAILSMDDYFKGSRFMKSICSDNWDEPRAFDLKLLLEHIKQLKSGLTIEKPVYSFKIGDREGYTAFSGADLIILEGLFVLYEPIVREVDLKIFVDISVHGSLLRRLIRDVGRTGQKELDIFKQYVETVYPMYKIYIEPTKSRADIVIVNQYVPEIETEKCQSREIHIKAPFMGRVPRKRLRLLGFRETSVSSQEDTYFTAPGWNSPFRELMRIRKEGGRYFLAYKGPSRGSRFAVKPKIEFEVEPALKDALERLGYKKALSYRKQREKWLGEGVELAVDRIEKDGVFLEFRTADPKKEPKILAYFAKLGVDKNSITKKSYLEMIIESGK